MEEMRRIVLLQPMAFELDLDYFRHHREKDRLRMGRRTTDRGSLYTPALEDLLGPARKADEPSSSTTKTSHDPCRRCTRRRFFTSLHSLHPRHGSTCDRRRMRR